MSDKQEQRLQELETLVSYQEDTIETLSKHIALHEKEIQQLNHKLNLLSDYLKNMKLEQSSGIKMPNEESPPPHY